MLLVNVTRNFQAEGNVDWDTARLLDMCKDAAMASFKMSIQEFVWKGRNTTTYVRGAQIPGARSLWWPKFVRWHLIFVDDQCGKLLRVTFFAPRVFRWLLNSQKIYAPLTYVNTHGSSRDTRSWPSYLCKNVDWLYPYGLGCTFGSSTIGKFLPRSGHEDPERE